MTLASLDFASPRRFGRDATPIPITYDSWILTFALYVYLGLYVTEGLSRYLLGLVHLDAGIYIRDVLLFGGALHVLGRQVVAGRVDPFVLTFMGLMLFHGIIGALNLQSIIPVLANLKAFLSIPVGALLASRIFSGDKRLQRFMLALWLVGFVAAGLEKYLIDYPWIGLKVEIAGQEVEVGHDWQTGFADKRAGGLARSSIHLAAFMSIVGTLVFFGTRSLFARGCIGAITLVTLFWTTQKGALVAVALMLPVGLLPARHRVVGLKILLTVFVLLMIALPTILPGYIMPREQVGLFTMASFFDRIERMWPDAWVWYDQKALPLIGVGLGGIGIGMRFYSREIAFYAADISSYQPYLINSADNMFVYLYVQFGIAGLIYIAMMVAAGYRQPVDAPTATVQALATLVFLIGYGVAISIIEDQVAGLFLGAALHKLWLAGRRTGESARVARIGRYAVPVAPALNPGGRRT